ncbi:MAG TPA: elongation factor P [Tenuifilaceae bacterium]|nr:elongation factor P [Bacteroidales bacterium]HNT41551.1 elongation factor P [Tenuifilaceae bacterium]HNY09812.1 elongation factor P [Tenuifilaceae bacterium]HOA09553.1 elongation factor P [Tenuifilaceae bacterium]HOC36451.1 elongation factor P [Tenuifilaceae bacterium]
MATTADFKNGLCIEFNGKLYTIVQFQHVKPGKGGAFVRTKLKNLETGKVIENTFTSGVKINVVRVERRPYQFLYKDDLGFHFMHQETFEQVSLSGDLIENADLLKEGQYVEMMVEADKENILTCELPPFVEMEVTYTEPGLKGDTASSTALKPATVETGSVINVPLFVNTGDKIRIDTRTREYYERVK